MHRQHKNSGGPAPEIIAYNKKGREAGLSANELANLVGMSRTTFRGYLYSRDLPDHHCINIKHTTKLLNKALKSKQLPLSVEFKVDIIKNILLNL